MEKVVISGGTGLVGNRLIKSLKEKGYEITVLSRSKNYEKDGVSYRAWDPQKGELDRELIDEADHIINLAGANVADKRWTESYKKMIRESRVLSTRLLVSKANESPNHLKSFISTSAINFYGIKRKGKVTEDTGPGEHFLSDVCVEWEKETEKLDTGNTRLVIIRVSTVLASEGGPLREMIKPVKFGVGSPLGPGTQLTPWIHIEDLVNLYLYALEKDHMSGVYNAAAPENTPNKKMMRTIAKKLRRPMVFPNVPILALKVMIGEFADVLLTDFDLDTSKLEEAGFQFQYPNIEEAIDNLL